MKVLRGIFLVGFCLFAIGISAKDLYRWVDESGGIHFTDNFHSVPEKYRDQVEKKTLPSNPSPISTLEPQLGQSQFDTQPQTFVVPFTRSGNAMIVHGLINGRGPVEFILDTGASLTIISSAQAKKVGIDPQSGNPIPVTGVGGTAVVHQVKINSLILSGAEVKGLEVAIHPGFRNRGLLGMDFLSEFRMDINNAQKRITLAHQPGRHEGRSPQWWQQRFRFLHNRKKQLEHLRSITKSTPGRKLADSQLQEIEKKISELETRASHAGVPREFRR